MTKVYAQDPIYSGECAETPEDLDLSVIQMAICEEAR